MNFDQLIPATLRRRYQRFLADVELPGGELITVHCPNTGAMTGCAEPGWRVWLSVSDSPTRKYPHSWELVETDRGMACIHSARANRVVEEAIGQGLVTPLARFNRLDREVKYGERSRADLRLSREDAPDCFIEVKCVTLCRKGGVGLFPDAVSARAKRHLLELAALAGSGRRAVIFFCVFHEGIREVRPAFDIDPAYCDALQAAVDSGVEAMAWGTRISPAEITLLRELPVVVEP